MKNIIFILITLSISINLYSQTTYTWNGSTSSNWNTAANWAPAGVPTASDHVVIAAAANIPTLANNVNITNFTLNSGNINLNGFTLTCNGNVTINNGNINGGPTSYFICNNGNVNIGTASTSITVNVRFYANVPSINIRNSTFEDTCIIFKNTTSTVNNSWNGGNVFNNYFYLENQSNNDIYLGQNASNPDDTFNGLAEFRISGNCRIRVRQYGNVTFNGKAKFYCDQNYFTSNSDDRIQISRHSPSSAIFNDSAFFYLTGNNYNDFHLSYDAGTNTTFNAHVLLYRLNNNNNQSQFIFGVSGGTIVFNQNVLFFNNGTNNNSNIDIRNATLNSGAAYITNPTDFSGGSLHLTNNSQLDIATPQNIILSSTSRLFLNGNTWNGVINFSSGQIQTQNSTYNNQTSLIKTGTTNDISPGGNTFNGITTFVKSASSTGYFLMGNTNPDFFNNKLFVKNLSSAQRIFLANNSAGNQFNDDIEFECSGSNGGILIGNTASSSSTLASGKIMTISSTGFTTGDLRFINFTQLGSTAQNLTITGSGYIFSRNATWNGPIQFIAPRVWIETTTHNNTAYWEKTGANNDNSPGGNTFNGITTIAKSASSTGFIAMGNSNPDFFNNKLFVKNLSNGERIILANNSAGNQFNDDIEFECTGSNGGIWIGNTASSSSTLASGKIMTISSTGFTTGDLRFINFTQLGTAAQNLTITGTGYIWTRNTVWNGPTQFIAPRVWIETTTHNNTAYWEKTGANNDHIPGGNTFNGITTIAKSASSTGFIAMGNSNPDFFNNKLFVKNLSNGERIILANNSAGNQFNDDIEFECTGSNGGIWIGNTASSSSTLASGKIMTISSTGFTTGDLRFINFTQLGSTAQNLTITGSGYIFSRNATWNGPIQFIAPRVWIQNTTHNNTAYWEKTGANNDHIPGGNTFNGITTIAKSASSTGFIAMGNSNPDFFNNKLFVKNLSSAQRIFLANNSAGNQFNDDIEFECSGSNGGIQIGNNASSSSTLASGKVMSIGAAGFTTGDLGFVNFTQLGTAAQNLTITGTGYIWTRNTVWNGPTQFIAPRVWIETTTHNNTAYWEKTGANNDNSPGGNTFNGITTIAKSASSTGFIAMGNSNPDFFNNKLFVKNLSNGERIILANNSAGNQFNDDIEFECTGSNGGIWIGNTASSSSTLASGKIMTISSTGFTTGDLRFINFTQLGSTAQNLTITGSGYIFSRNATWNGPIQFIAPRVWIQNTTHNNTAYWEKTGANNDHIPGGNTFNNDVTLSNMGTGSFRMSNVTGSPDTYNGNVTWKQTGTGALEPSCNNTEYYYGNINFDGDKTITAAIGTGRVVLAGSAHQTINLIGTNPGRIIRRLRIDKSSNEVTLNTRLSITVNADFINGIVNTTTSNTLAFANTATATGASDASFVNGPVEKTGNQAFTFPVGKKGNYYGMHFYNAYRPVSISAPSNSTHQFRAEYFMNDPHPAYNHGSLGPGLSHISNCEYWILDRTIGTSNVNVTLSYRDFASAVNCSGVTNQADLRVARWNGTQWVSHGNGGTTGTISNGEVVTSAPVTAFSPFTLASANSATNPLPVELLSFTAQPKDKNVYLNWSTATEINNDYFELQKSIDGINFESFAKVNGAGFSNQILYYSYIDKDPYIGTSYYRLKQVDFDGTFSYSEYIAVNFNKDFTANINFYPNPSSGIITFNIPEFENILIELYDLTGKKIYVESININSNTINLNNFANGVYLLSAKTSDGNRLLLDKLNLIK